MGHGRSVPGASTARLAASIGLALGAAGLVFPAVVFALDAPCASRYPSPGPGGVDLQAACVANEVTQNYTSSGPLGSEAASTLALVLCASWIAAVLFFSLWRFVAGRAARRIAPVTPTSFWMCTTCRSFNGTEVTRCYRCRHPRPADAPTVDAPDVPPWEQRFGRPFGS
jgi:hypothetical protein